MLAASRWSSAAAVPGVTIPGTSFDAAVRLGNVWFHGRMKVDVLKHPSLIRIYCNFSFITILHLVLGAEILLIYFNRFHFLSSFEMAGVVDQSKCRCFLMLSQDVCDSWF